MNPPTICLMGASLETGNRGVSALAVSLVKIFDHLFPEAQIMLFAGSRQGGAHRVALAGKEREITICNYRRNPRALFSNHFFWLLLLAFVHRAIPLKRVRRLLCRNRRFAWLQAADVVADIWGGDSFSDIYGTKRFLRGALERVLMLCLGKPLILLPQTYGPYRTPLARFVARGIMRRARLCMSRDAQGPQTIGRLLGPKAGSAVAVCPDVAFVLDPLEPPEVRCRPRLGWPCTETLVGINISGLLYNGGYTGGNMFDLNIDYQRLAHDMVAQVAAQPGTRVLLIPHTIGPAGNVNNDRDACTAVMQTLAAECRSRIHIVDRDYDQSGIKAIIGRCDFFLGSRMHACIAALSQGIPTLGIAYSRKFMGVFASVDAADAVIDARSATHAQVLEAIALMLSGAGEPRTAGIAAGTRVMQTFRDLSDWCFRGDS